MADDNGVGSIHARRGSAEQLGGCNACPNRGQVVEVRVGGLTFRLCRPCASALARDLRREVHR